MGPGFLRLSSWLVTPSHLRLLESPSPCDAHLYPPLCWDSLSHHLLLLSEHFVNTFIITLVIFCCKFVFTCFSPSMSWLSLGRHNFWIIFVSPQSEYQASNRQYSVSEWIAVYEPGSPFALFITSRFLSRPLCYRCLLSLFHCHPPLSALASLSPLPSPPRSPLPPPHLFGSF